MLSGILLTLGALLLVLIGVKVASWIDGTPLNLLIGLVLLALSSLAASLMFIGNPHSEIILAIGVAGSVAVFFLVGLCIRLAKKWRLGQWI